MFTPGDVNLSRVLNEISTLSEFGRTQDGGITRPTFSKAHLQATEAVASWMSNAGLAVHFDRWRNLFARTPGADSSPCILTGSHLDSVPNGGNYDGPLGVLSSLEAARLILEKSIPLKRPVEVVAFIEEEGSRFRGLMGSTLAVKGLTSEQITALKDTNGDSFLDLVEQFRPDYPIKDMDNLTQRVSHYLELHIEQGVRLERANIPIGIVTSIAGPRFWRVTLTGQADHAGATDYENRRDALLTAAEIITAIRELGVNSFAEAARMTVGKLHVQPNVVNVVASEVILDIDTRTATIAAYDEVEAAQTELVRSICEKHHLTYKLETVQQVLPAISPDSILNAVQLGSQQAGVTSTPIVSWAAHDAMIMSKFSQSGMIFVPCRDGRSHCPEEYVEPEHIAAGIAVLANALVQLGN